MCQRNPEQLNRPAKKHGIRTIAFPAISCGVYGYPLDEAAEIAVRETRAVEAEMDRILLVAFGGDVFRALEQSLRR